jgi:hypothetical protein
MRRELSHQPAMKVASLLVVCSVICVAQAKPQVHAAPGIVAPQKVANLVEPILGAMAEAMQKQPMDESRGAPLWRCSVHLAHLFEDQSPSADEALVTLFGHYLGESNGEDLVHEVIIRGRRMVLYLNKYQRHSVQIPGRQYPASIRLPPRVRNGFLQEAITSIKNGLRD